MEKLRVTIFFGSFTVGGGQRVVFETIRKIDQSKIDLTVVCYEGKVDTVTEHEAEKICPIVFLNEKGKVTLAKAWRIFSALNATKPDVVHVHLGGMIYAVPWAILFSVPLLITAHTKPSQAFVPAVLPLIKWGLKNKRLRIAAVSKENYLLMQQYFRIDDDRLLFVNNGIDIERFFSVQHEHFTFINVARQDDNKNQAQIIRCFARIHKEFTTTKMYLVGDGPNHSKLRDLISKYTLNDAVELTGSKSNVEEYYAISDVYVQSSLREAMPMSVLEAMAAGLTIISTDVGGLRDVVAGNGYLLPVLNDDAMYEAMRAMIVMSSEARNAMKIRSKEIVEGYSSCQMAQKYTQEYQRMSRMIELT